MWAAIKKAINSRLGRKNFKALDEIISKECYESYYNTMRDMVCAFGDGNGKIVIHPKNKTIVAEREYLNQEALETVVLPLGLESIGNMAFQGTSISHLIIPEGVKNIGFQIVDAGTHLTELKIPKSLETAEEDAFYNVLGDMYLPFSEGEIAGAPWGFAGTVHYDCD